MDNGKYGVGCGVLAGVALLSVLFMFFSGAQVDAGHVGVAGSFGSIDRNQEPLPPGFHVVLPLVTHIESVSVQPQNHQFQEVGAASKELQNVYVDGGVNFHIDPKRAAQLQIDGGLEAVVSRVFNPAFQDFMKETVPQYSTTDILVHRADIRDQVKSRLAEKASPVGITVDDVFITNIHFDKGYTQAIEAAAEAQQRLAKTKIDAQSAVTQAEGEAAANRARQSSLNDQILRARELDNQKAAIDKWDGKMPQVQGSGTPLINLSR